MIPMKPPFFCNLLFSLEFKVSLPMPIQPIRFRFWLWCKRASHLEVSKLRKSLQDGDLTDAVEVFDLGSRAMHSDTLEARLIGEYRTSDLFANDAQLTRFNPASTQQIDAADLALTIGPISLLSDSQPAQALPSASHRRLRL